MSHRTNLATVLANGMNRGNHVPEGKLHTYIYYLYISFFYNREWRLIAYSQSIGRYRPMCTACFNRCQEDPPVRSGSHRSIGSSSKGLCGRWITAKQSCDRYYHNFRPAPLTAPPNRSLVEGCWARSQVPFFNRSTSKHSPLGGDGSL